MHVGVRQSANGAEGGLLVGDFSRSRGALVEIAGMHEQLFECESEPLATRRRYLVGASPGSNRPFVVSSSQPIEMVADHFVRFFHHRVTVREIEEVVVFLRPGVLESMP